MLQIDAVFMPVRRVNYTIDETAVGEGGSAVSAFASTSTTSGPPSPQTTPWPRQPSLIALFPASWPALTMV